MTEQGTGPRTGPKTLVHLVRHGEVHNPDGVLYGRLDGYHLSELGRAMADKLAEHFAQPEFAGSITHLRCSPLERAQETMRPIAAVVDLPVVTDGRVIEAGNRLEGQRMPAALKDPRNWWLLRNPTRPSWGESYPQIADRVHEAIKDAAAAAEGHQAIIVSHQLPIWISRLAAEGRRFTHDPRKRECTLASVTTLTVIAGRVAGVSYAEPAGDLLPKRLEKGFVAGA